MTDITLTCANYVRQMPLVSGEVAMAGGTLRLRLSEGGSWPSRAAALRDALQDPSVAGGEASMGIHLNRIDRGDRSFVALPIFVLRNFTARDLYVRQGSPITSVEQLAGKRVGMYSWTASGSIWYRHFLAWAGLDPLALKWWIGEIDKAYAPRIDASLPAGSERATRPLSEMLVDGELDAIYSPSLPLRYDAENGPIVRLLRDYRAIELRYFQDTGVFPPQHLVVLRRDVWEADPSLARRVTDAFVRCEAAVQESLRGFPYASPWFEAEQERSAREIGTSVYAHGFEENRAAMQQFVAMAYGLGLSSREVTLDDYFAEYLQS
jgi:4,5-dihydroxyphthalate decarboxylase